MDGIAAAVWKPFRRPLSPPFGVPGGEPRGEVDVALDARLDLLRVRRAPRGPSVAAPSRSGVLGLGSTTGDPGFRRRPGVVTFRPPPARHPCVILRFSDWSG